MSAGMSARRLALRCLLPAMTALLLALAPAIAQTATPQRVTGPQLLRMIEEGRYPLAERVLAQQISRAGGQADPRIHYLYGFVLQQQFRLAEAEPQLRAAVAGDGSRSQWWQVLATNLLQQGRCGEAITALEQAWRLEPRPTLRLNIALCALNLGELERAEHELRAVLAAEPANPEALHRLGALLIDAGNAAEALPLLERAVAAAPDDVEARFALGLAESGTEQWQAAAESFRQVRAAVPGHAGAAYNLGLALRRLGRGDESRAVLLEFQPLAERDDLIENHRQYVQLDATNPTPRRDLGGMLLEAGRVREALEQLEAARSLDPRDAETWRLLAAGYRQLGRTADADAADAQAARLRKAPPNTTTPDAPAPDLPEPPR
jgi:Flp pilus assembly protein TadD